MRWCAIPSEHGATRHVIPLYYCIYEKNLPDFNRSEILSRACALCDFKQEYFEKRIDPYSHYDLEYKEDTTSHDSPRCIHILDKPKTIESTKPKRAKRSQVMSEIVDSYITKLNELAGSSDNGNLKRRLFRYEKTFPLFVVHFLDRLSQLQQRSLDRRISTDARTPAMLAIEEEAKQCWPPEAENKRFWIIRKNLSEESKLKMTSLRKWARADRAFYVAFDGLSGWDHDKRYWRSLYKEGLVYYYQETKNGFVEDENIDF